MSVCIVCENPKWLKVDFECLALRMRSHQDSDRSWADFMATSVDARNVVMKTCWCLTLSQLNSMIHRSLLKPRLKLFRTNAEHFHPNSSQLKLTVPSSYSAARHRKQLPWIFIILNIFSHLINRLVWLLKFLLLTPSLSFCFQRDNLVEAEWKVPLVSQSRNYPAEFWVSLSGTIAKDEIKKENNKDLPFKWLDWS